MKKFVVLLLLIMLFVVACSSSSGSDPAQTVEKYMQAKADANADTIRQLDLQFDHGRHLPADLAQDVRVDTGPVVAAQGFSTELQHDPAVRGAVPGQTSGPFGLCHHFRHEIIFTLFQALADLEAHELHHLGALGAQ